MVAHVRPPKHLKQWTQIKLCFENCEDGVFILFYETQWKGETNKKNTEQLSSLTPYPPSEETHKSIQPRPPPGQTHKIIQTDTAYTPFPYQMLHVSRSLNSSFMPKLQ